MPITHDVNWPRWIYVSVSKHFKDVANFYNYNSLVENVEDSISTFQETGDRVEIRVNGPFTKELSHNYFHFEVDANILITSHMGGPSKNPYGLMDMVGVMAATASQIIPVYKYGNGPDDDEDELVGCLTLRKGPVESIKSYYFGEIDSTNRLRQAMVDVRLEMQIYP